MNDIVVINKTTDLCYSPDDNGWHFQEYVRGADRVSRVYPTRRAAEQAFRDDTVEWESWNEYVA